MNRLLKNVFLPISLAIVSVFVALAITIPTATTGYIEQEIDERLLAEGGLIGEEIEGFFNANKKVVDLLTLYGPLQEMIMGDKYTEEQWDGVETYLKSVSKQQEAIYCVWFADATTNYYIQDDGVFLGEPEFTFKKGSWYEAASSTKETLITGVYLDKVSGNKCISIIKPLYNGDTLEATIGVDVNIEYIFNVIESYLEQHDTRVSLVDQYNNVLFDNDPEVLGMNIDDLGLPTSLVEALKGSESKVLHYEFNNQGRTGSITPIHSLGWKVLSYEAEEEVVNIKNKIYLNIAVFCVIGLVFIGIIAYLLLGKLIKAVNELVNSCNRIAEGDLSYDLPEEVLTRKDEMGTLAIQFDKMQSKIKSLIGHIKKSSEEVNDTANAIYESSVEETKHVSGLVTSIDDVAQTALVQAQDTQKGVDEMDGLQSLITCNSEEVKRFNTIYENINGLIDLGNSSIEDLSTKTVETKDTSQEVLKAIEALQSSVAKIQVANDLMLHIGQQTNLLALNASIEAARAGESGRGFAVVAQEITTLSKQSTDAASSINEMVVSITCVTATTIESIQNIINLIYSQAKSVEDTKEKYYTIASTISESNNIIERFNNIQQEMMKKTQTVAGVIQNLEVIANENAATSQNGIAIAEDVSKELEKFMIESKELTSLSEELQAILIDYKL